MQKIDEGFFYEVFDLENGRVLKKQKSFFAIARSIKGKNNISVGRLWLKTFLYITNCKQTTRAVRKKLDTIPQELIGHPKFINAVEYEQDKVVLLMDYFANHAIEENKVAVNEYADLILKFLTYGMHDYVYKFKNSYGFNQENKLIFIDFNEATLFKEQTLDMVRNKHWLQEAQFKKFGEGELKEYIQFQFDQKLTCEAVENLWNNKKYETLC